ncbi:hypothetical protein M3210_00075 [Oceanobacillus luteolus]|uniref:hypothetical protein n=1 Tax=Oceanobacillus luteolus TaxID=1274358 RepID=UPI0020420412|nr:hypothetical protein [Oceanobacillus luteolus]MCM3738654.1 hypothetical protein [Oceanobacillus luteolus]
MHCPNCRGKNLGKIGVQLYYCWTCYIELSIEKGKLNMNQIEPDGSLSPLNDLFSEEERTILEDRLLS